MKSYIKLAAAAVMAAGTLALTATSASAYIVCNGEGECWHTHHHYTYQSGFGLVVHPDGWAWGPSEHYVWREPAHAGRGYWRGGVWIRF
jgi:hypothetical protein